MPRVDKDTFINEMLAALAYNEAKSAPACVTPQQEVERLAQTVNDAVTAWTKDRKDTRDRIDVATRRPRRSAVQRCPGEAMSTVHFYVTAIAIEVLLFLRFDWAIKWVPV